MKLYFNPQSRALVSKWLLDEAGVPHELVPIDLRKGEHKAPDFLRINPNGKLPALADGDVHVFENVAIALYIADKFPHSGLAPAIGSPERGRYLSLMVWATSQLEPSMGDALLQQPHLPARGWNEFETVKDVVEGELRRCGGPYLFGGRFTAADVLIGSMFIWQRMWGKVIGRPALDVYVDRLMQRPHSMKAAG